MNILVSRVGLPNPTNGYNNQMPGRTGRARQLLPHKLSLFILVMVSLFLYSNVVQFDTPHCIFDRLHEWTSSQNKRINEDKDYQFWMTLLGQVFIDLAFVTTLGLYLFGFLGLPAFFWMLGFYGFRAILLNIVEMPFPKGTIWNGPGIPSLSVPYGLARDFFYSGHTGFMLLSVTMWWSSKCKYMRWITVIGLLQVIYLLIVARVHYTIDIFGGLIFSRLFLLVLWPRQKQLQAGLKRITGECWDWVKGVYHRLLS